MRSGGIFIVSPTMKGVRRLSINPTAAKAQTPSPIASGVCPDIRRNIMAGTETKAVPIVGTREHTLATTPQSAAFGTPKIKSPNPITSPWMRAIISEPFMTAFTDWDSLVIIFSSSLSPSGERTTIALFHFVPVLKKKKNERKNKEKRKKADRVAVNILAILFEVKEINPDIFA